MSNKLWKLSIARVFMSFLRANQLASRVKSDVVSSAPWDCAWIFQITFRIGLIIARPND